MSLPLLHVKPGDWKVVDSNFNKIKTSLLGGGASPTFAGLTLTGLTASRLVATNGSKGLISSDLYGWVNQTANQVLIADAGVGKITFSTPQDIHSAASNFTVAGATIEKVDGAQNLTLLKLYNNKTAANGDRIRLAFHAQNNTGEDIRYINLGLYVYDKTNGNEKGGFTIEGMVAGVNRSLWTSSGANQPYGGSVFNDGAVDIDFRVESKNPSAIAGNYRAAFFVQASDGTIGFGELYPETHVQMTGPTPYFTFHNNTEEDSDGGGEIRIIGKREDGSGTETTAGQIEISHDGSGADDQLGKIVASVNTGAGLVQALEIGSDLLATFAGNLDVAVHDAGTVGLHLGGTLIEASAAELNTLTDGSNADALHDHTEASVTVTHASTTGRTTDDHHAQSHNVASHSDTSATGAELNTLTNDSMADALHRHSELSASDGTPNPAVQVDADGKVGIGTATPGRLLELNSEGTGLAIRFKAAAVIRGDVGVSGGVDNIIGGSVTGDITIRSDANSILFSAGIAGASTHVIIKDTTGFVGIQTLTPTLPLSVLEKSGRTSIGGSVMKLTNKTGGNSIAGQLVAVYSATAVNDAVKTAGANSDEVIGITLDAGIADGSEMWVVVSGIADVLMDGGGSARGDRIISSATAGSADVWNVGGAVATHFQEIGHCVETRTGAGLARCVLHFN